MSVSAGFSASMDFQNFPPTYLSLDTRRFGGNLLLALAKNNPNWAIISIVLVCLLQSGSPAIGHENVSSCPSPELAKDKKYQPGQVWQYKTRAGEEGSRITVLRVERLLKVGVIVHVRVDRIRLRNCAGGPEADNFQHMPFTKDALDRSVTKLEKDSVAIPDLSGYEQWRADCGGVYTITVAEAIKAAEYTFNKGLGCEQPNAPKTSR